MKKLLILTALFFIACSSKVVIKNYTLTSFTPDAQKISKTISLKVSATPILQTRKIYWQKGYEKNPYQYSQWIDDFDNLIKKSIYNALFKTYKNVYFNKNADINLKLFIVDATHIIKKENSYIFLDIKASANNKTKEFSYKINCSKNAESAVEAFNKAIKIFEKDLINWLNCIF